MKFLKWNLFKKSRNPMGAITSDQIFDYWKHGSHDRVSPSSGYRLYENIGTVADAVDTISTKFSEMKPVVVDSNNKVVKNKEIERFFRTPNDFESWNEFSTNMSTNYLLHNNLFLQVMGNIKSSPLSIYSIRNDAVNITPSNNRAMYQITVSGLFHFLSGVFHQSSVNPRILDGSDLRELYHVRGFDQHSDTLLSCSKLSSIKRDIDVVDESLLKLKKALEDGFSASAFASLDTNDEQAFEQFVKDLKNKNSGAGNTNSIIAAMGKDLNIKMLDQTNRDLQTNENKKDSMRAIYSRYEIPQPLVDQSAQTYNNYQTALYSLYDSAVIPLAKKIFEKLTSVYRDRGILGIDESISFDSSSIPALQLRLSEEMKLLKDVGAHSINEVRSIYGSKIVGPEGDQIFIEASKIPIGEDSQSQDSPKEKRKSMVFDLKKSGFKDDEIIEYMREYEEISGTE